MPRSMRSVTTRSRASERRMKMRTRLEVALLALVVLLMTGCASGTPGTFETAAPAAPPNEYIVQRGDTLTIKFYYHPDHDQEAVVRPDGKMVLSPVGDIPAAGLTPAAIAEQVRAVYARSLRDPKVAVSVKTMNENRVYVGGEVNRPGFVVYREGLTAVQAVLEAGGPRDTGKVDEVVFLQREGDKGYRPSKINLAKVLEDGDTTADQRLGPSDVIFVPKTAIAKLDLFIDQHIMKVLPLRPGATYLIP